MVKPEQLATLLHEIHRQGVDFETAVIGGVAAIAHGVYRSTVDLDLLVDTGDLDLLDFRIVIKKLLEENRDVLPGLEELGPLSIKSKPASRPGSSEPLKNALIALFAEDGMRVLDFMGVYYEFDREALDRRIELDKLRPVGVIDSPYLVLMKLNAGGPKDKLDVYEVYTKSAPQKKNEIVSVAKKYEKISELRDVLALYDVDISKDFAQSRGDGGV